jgi:Holliday junction resolvase
LSINSLRKGKAGEREFANLCKQHGFDARRGQQYSGIEGKDIVGLAGVHVEVKRVERLNVSKAMDQAHKDAKCGEVPIVAHRKNREPWFITMPAEAWFEFYRTFIAIKDRRGKE